MADHTQRKWIFASALGVVVCLLVSCQPVKDYFNYTRAEPKKEDLVGVWSPDESSLRDMKGRGGYDPQLTPKLILRSDGSFELTNMPDWWRNRFGESRRTFESFSGSWSISQRTSEFWELDLNSPGAGMVVELFGQHMPYRLNFVIGDPDSDHAMVFTKE